jgi:endonuclease/exonuclease/phosphatase family metal-dependent hydrolase
MGDGEAIGFRKFVGALYLPRTMTFHRTILLCLFLAATCRLSAQKGPLRLLTYNIRNAKGMDGKMDYDRTAAVLSRINADIVCLQEVDSATKRSGGGTVMDSLARRTGYLGVFGAAIPFQGGSYGVAVLSRKKPLRSCTVALPGREEGRVLLIVEFRQYVIFNTHLSLTPADRLASLDIINTQAARIKKPIYLLGDLNASPAEPLITGLQASWSLLSGIANSFPAPRPDRCIDYIFCRNNRKTVKTATVIAEPMASDHRPVFVELK